VLLYLKEKRARQSTFLVWENVYLVRARDISEAAKKGEAFGRADCAPDETLTVDGRPATLVFGGVRRIVWCAESPHRGRTSTVSVLRDGVEATFSTFVVRGRRDLSSLLAGRPALVRYEG
jgi:hypothetical protein